ncbi:hypothetical protein CTI12_AA240190 [Artemisia annua]|uniref:Transmembrane protein n=1 Tax=Artemisia annua TaxID=35608 RepID=A0A2U1NQ82_ARTAN|nr:hypothetical protein CTI12_AA240190 [Artemisia annua]
MNRISGFLELLKEPFKILTTNGKLMAITASIYLTIYSLSCILFTFSIKPLIVDLILKLFALSSAHPGTPEYTELLVAIRKDTGAFLGIEAACIVFLFFVNLFAETTVVIIASCYYNGDNLSLKELFTTVLKTWTRPFVTLFYVRLLVLGYISIFFWPFLIPSLILFDHSKILITLLIVLAIIFITFNLYLSVVWSLAVVVSVVEDTYGLSALGKAREVMKGNRVHGFLLNLLYMLVLTVIFTVVYKLSPMMPIVVGVIEFILIGVLSMFQFLAYSAFYFECKNDMVNSRGLEYSQIPTAPVIDEDLP